jgi:hypothetical protein
MQPDERSEPGGRLNANYGTLRQWQSVADSNYNGLQVALRKQMSHGLVFKANYTWSHSLDDGSSRHNSATSANHQPAGGRITLADKYGSLRGRPGSAKPGGDPCGDASENSPRTRIESCASVAHSLQCAIKP